MAAARAPPASRPPPEPPFRGFPPRPPLPLPSPSPSPSAAAARARVVGRRFVFQRRRGSGGGDLLVVRADDLLVDRRLRLRRRRRRKLHAFRPQPVVRPDRGPVARVPRVHPDRRARPFLAEPERRLQERGREPAVVQGVPQLRPLAHESIRPLAADEDAVHGRERDEARVTAELVVVRREPVQVRRLSPRADVLHLDAAVGGVVGGVGVGGVHRGRRRGRQRDARDETLRLRPVALRQRQRRLPGLAAFAVHRDAPREHRGGDEGGTRARTSVVVAGSPTSEFFSRVLHRENVVITALIH